MCYYNLPDPVRSHPAIRIRAEYQFAGGICNAGLNGLLLIGIDIGRNKIGKIDQGRLQWMTQYFHGRFIC